MNRDYRRAFGDAEPAHDEFLPGASDPPDAMSRREMMTLVGATAAFAGLTGCRRPVEHIVPYVEPPEYVMPGVPKRYATTMPFGRSAYGLLVESHEGRPTKIEGNELHPGTLGASSVRMQASILGLYDPDRSSTPLRAGEKSDWASFVAAWKELEAAHLADGGAGLAVLTESFSSPTLARLLGALASRFPQARVATWEPAGDESVLEGVRLVTGRELLPIVRLEGAEVVLAIDADLFGADAESHAHARGFAAGRDPSSMSRLWVAEAAHTVTGGMADHRLRVANREMAALVAAVVERVAGTGASSVAGVEDRVLDALAKDLREHRGKGLVVAGPTQPPEIHGAVLALNALLGNVGSTVLYREPNDARSSSLASLRDLVSALDAGSVETLVILGGNPAYDAPADLDFAAAMGKAKTSIALGMHVDETSKLATWHLPRAHYLEAWEDARDVAGILSVVQPLIAPLLGGKSAVELLGLLATGDDRSGHDLVRETWTPILGADGFEGRWRRVLHDGLLAGSELPTVVPELSRIVTLAPSSFPGVEILFRPSPWIHDGRFANCGWLQELPEPISKVTWDNPALLSPATASRLGIANGDVVKVEAGGRSLEIPAWIVPGQADETVVLTLGYGRREAGRVGNGVGVDVYPLRASSNLSSFRAGTIAPTGASAILATTQAHGSMEGRPIVREGTLAEYRENPAFAAEAVEVPPLESMWKEKSWDHGYQWGMAIDLNRCVGCNACAVACQSENNVPIVGKDQVRRGREMAWIRIDRYYAGPEEAPELVFQPVPCMQCENAPCEQVCPVAATVHDDEGLNVMVYNRCIGTRYCSNNCPYKVRRFNFYNFTKDTPEILKLAQNPDVTVRARGVMEKCTYCIQRINAGKLDARLAGRELKDGDVRTACQQACPASAITFGDLRDAESAVVKAKADPRNYALLAELNTKPRTTYLARVRNPHPDLEGA